MQIGIVGLGRMGANMARRLMRGAHDCIVYDVDASRIKELAAEGATGAQDLGALASQLTPPRAVWLMLPAGEITGNAVTDLASHLHPGDVIIDGGNSYFKDDIARANQLRDHRIDYLDAGTSGGVWGLERGYCLMVGGPRPAFERLEPIFRTLAPGVGDVQPTPGRKPGTAELGYIYCGPNGAGHFVKMIHNGIEYGLMQSYAEGFDILRNACSDRLASECRYEFDLAEIAEVWRRGSVITSWLLDLTAMALAEDPDLSEYTGSVADSGEGRWTIHAALEEAVPAQVLAASLYARFRSREQHTFGEKMLSAMRNKFGGHVESVPGG